MGKIVVALGVGIALVGALLWLLEAVTGRTAGRLPGDIHIQRGNLTIYFPIVTCLALSVILTLILSLIARRR